MPNFELTFPKTLMTTVTVTFAMRSILGSIFLSVRCDRPSELPFNHMLISKYEQQLTDKFKLAGLPKEA